MRKCLKTALASMLCLSLLTGCGSSSSSSEKSVSVNLGSEPPEMLSFLTSDSTSGDVLRHVMETLVTLDADNNVVPGVAKEVPTKENGGISEDGLTYTFKLNPKAKWSDGTTVTAGDFEYAWDQLFTAKNGASYASTWAPLIVGANELLEAKTDADYAECLKNKGWKALDDETFEVKLTGPYTYFNGIMTFYNFAPLQKEAYENGGGVETYANDAEGFVGNGPYVFKSWEHDNQIVLEKNENYWNKNKIDIEEITFRMISDTNTTLNEFENGTIDMVGLTGEQANKLEKDGKKVLSYSDGSVWYFEYNVNVPGLNNAKVRKALSLAYDIDAYIDTVKNDGSVAAQTFTGDAVRSGAFTESLGNLYERPKTEADYAELKKLFEEGLAEEGLTPDTFKIKLTGDTGDDALKQYAFFQEQWQKHLGIKVDINQVEFKTRIANMNSGDFDIVFAGWSPDYDDPMSYLDLWLTGGGNNHGKYSNPEYDAAVKTAYMEGDQTVRDGYLKQAEEIIASDFPVGPIYNRRRNYICSDRLTGVVRTAFSDIDLRYAKVK